MFGTTIATEINWPDSCKYGNGKLSEEMQFGKHIIFIDLYYSCANSHWETPAPEQQAKFNTQQIFPHYGICTEISTCETLHPCKCGP